ncbi:MAG: PDZ domain-containing protein [Acidimicrobiales bacterium]
MDDDADDVPAGPPPPPAERPWRHPSELDERRSPAPSGPGVARAGPRRPGLWFVLTASALVGTVVAVIAVGLISEMRPKAAKGGEASAGSDPGSASTLVGDAPAVNEGRTLGPTITRRPVADRPWLGIQGTDAEGAVLVTGVAEPGPAATAGVEPGDLIVAAQQEAIDSMAALQALIARREPGDVLVLDLLRGDTRVRVMAVLGEWD